jgi:iron complex outermembrane receptor protein
MNSHVYQKPVINLRSGWRYAVAMACTSVLVEQSAFAQTVAAPSGSPKEYQVNQVVIESSPLQGTLFESAQPVTVLSGDELDAKAQGSLGDTLGTEAGVASSSFGPGAGRPVIRGLGGDRIRVLENGVGTLDISNSSPDHAVTIESSLVDKIEVVRGPASLLYGTSAVGGIVNVFDNRIPEKLPDAPVTGTAEVRGESVNRERAGLVSVTAPVGSFALHADGLMRRSDDIDIPGYARTAALRDSQPLEYPEPRGTLPYSAVDTDNATLGGSYIFDSGYLGAAVSEWNSTYGVPNGEPDISVDAQRRRLDVRGAVRDASSFVDSVTARIGAVDYDHTEYEGAEAGTEFMQNGFDGRVDFTHQKVGAFKGAWGLQLQDSRFKALGEEAFQPPTDSQVASAFLFESVDLSDTVTLQLGARYDNSVIDSDGFEEGASDDLSRDFNTLSQSSGIVWDFSQDYALALSVAHTERAPNGQELYADGPHVATGAYEIGDADLSIERSLGTDLTLRKQHGQWRGSIGGFYNRFWNYISLNPNGETEDDLPVYLFEQVNADFFGFESQVSYHVLDTAAEELSFDMQPDYVWARDRDNDEYLPRITPLRLKVGANYHREDLFRARLELQQVFAQHNTADFETSTDGYTFLNAYVSREVEIQQQPVELFVRGMNLLNEKARNHVSFIKDVAPLPGVSAMAGVRVRF